MDLVSGLVFVCLFLIGLCAVEHYTRRSPLPTVCWFVLFGVGYGLVRKNMFPGLPAMQVTPDTILYIFLPVLIFDASRKLDLKASEKMLVPSTLLATLGILLSMFVMAVPLRIVSGLPWIDILFFTAIMSATDPVAVTAVFTRFTVPKKLRMLIEGESLLNDGTTIILFTLLYDRVVSGEGILLSRDVAVFFLSVAGAIVIGAVSGAVCFGILRGWKALKDHFVGPLFPLLVVYLVFCGTQAALDISGVIAVMSATLVMRLLLRRLERSEMPSRIQFEFYRGFWDFLGDLANAVLFFMLGVAIGSHSGEMAWKPAIVAVLALLLSRSVVVYLFGAAFRFIRIRLSVSWLHVLNLGGLKGALSVALVLMIPEDYAYRHLFLLAALAMSLFTLLANPMALRLYLRKADLTARD